MENIVFVGSRINGYFAEEVAKTRGWGYHQIDIKNGTIKETTNDILTYIFNSRITADIIIFDVDAFFDTSMVIAGEIRGIANTINAKPVVYMPSFLPESEMARALMAKDIKLFIFSGSATDLKDQLEKNITGFFDANGRKEIDEIIRLQEEAVSRITNFKTIGVLGALDRTGTTTQALQIVKYLQYLGHTACYIELNSNKYYDLSCRDGNERSVSFVRKYKEWTGGSDDAKVTYEGIDMFHSMPAEEEKKNYEYHVFDYGSITSRDFDRTAYIKDDIKVIVSGAKPMEFDFLQAFLSIPVYSEASIILTFVPEEDREKVLKCISDVRNGLKVGNARPVGFADYTPEPFRFSNPTLYENIIPVEMTNEARERLKQNKKGKGLFKRKGR